MSDTPEIRTIVSSADRDVFTRAAMRDLGVLEQMLQDGGFESGVRRLGAEQELDFIDRDFRPAPLVPRIFDHLGDGPFVTEYAKFNMEINSSPHRVEGNVFTRLQNELADYLGHVAKVAEENFDAQTVLTGLLPTIRHHDVRPEALTPNPRYHTMLELVNRLRGRDYEFHIRGIDELVSRDNPTAFGGTFTSFQIHCQSDADLLRAHYNWSQMISAPVLAAATNSPLFLNRRLWRETRIALFAQTTDTRRPEANLRKEEPRVTFGRDWVRDDILEIFREDLSRHRPYVTHLPRGAGISDVPVGDLDALNFHTGTIYRWNRVCFGMGEKPHLRIENRILPSGPTLIDEMANTAFWLGLMLGMPGEARTLHDIVPFSSAHSNFNKAARSGLGVTFRWFGESLPARKLILERLLPLARKGLDAYQVDPHESGRLLGIIADRVSSGRTGSEWILDAFNSYTKTLSPGEASVRLTAEMVARASSGRPVHEWESVDEKVMVPKLHCNSTWTLEQVMDNDLITLHPDDSWVFAAKLMRWNDREFLPVVDDDDQLIGIVSKREVMAAIDNPDAGPLVDEIKPAQFVTLPVDASIEECLSLMKKNGTDCVAVLEAGFLAGMVTGDDIDRMAP